MGAQFGSAWNPPGEESAGQETVAEILRNCIATCHVKLALPTGVFGIGDSSAQVPTMPGPPTWRVCVKGAVVGESGFFRGQPWR